MPFGTPPKTPASAPKTVPEVQPFTEMPVLKPINVVDYPLSAYIKRTIQPPESIENAVAAIMVNLFIFLGRITQDQCEITIASNWKFSWSQ
jgi:hypothetical protein